MERKFVPEKLPNAEYREPFYLQTKFLICFAVVSGFVPLVGVIVAILVGLKKRRTSNYLKQLEDYERQVKEKAHADIQEIFAEAEEQLAKITAEADAKAAKSEEKAVTIVENANKRSTEIIAAANVDARIILSGAKRELADLESKIANRESTFAAIVDEANEEADRRNINARRELERIQAEIDKRGFYLREVETIKEEISKLEKKETSLIEKIDELMRLRKAINGAVKNYFKCEATAPSFELKLPIEIIREVEELAPSVILKLHSMDYKDLRRLFRANNKLIEDVLTRYENRYTLKNNRTIYRLMVIALRAELQNILYTLTSTKLNDAINSVRDVANKYLNIVREGNQTIHSTLAKFVGEIETLFIDAVKIEYEYFVKKEAARQEQLELRAKMREEAEEQRRLKEQQVQMDREESKYNAEIENLLEQARSVGDAKNQALLDKVRSLELQLAALSTKKEEILRLQNGKAGYVYVISNLGSFGADVFKVGMTRRLDPQERIDELGSASVPFKFDVHSFIFSEDAVKLESELHAALDSRRLNKVNNRKEFFKISIEELEKLVERFDPAAEFNRTMQAEQYYQSLSLVEENVS